MTSSQKHTLKSLLSSNTVSIPPIQRDYAFGRKNESRKREDFITSLIKGIRSEGGLHLDFVYGKTDNGKLILLDGQQRLTTLWLLAVYLDKNNDYLTNFSYETRTSSREFCISLLENLESNDLLELEKEKWFFNSWRYDPTITGMIEMLRKIHSQDLSGVTSDDLDKITFSFLDIEDLGEPEELYLKMNSRGKGLSDWDNFKAKLFGLDTVDQEFQKLVDGEMLDFFWKINQSNNPSKSTEKSLMKFFINILRIEAVLVSNKKESVNTSEKIMLRVRQNWEKMIDIEAIKRFYYFLNENKNCFIPCVRFNNNSLQMDDIINSLKAGEEVELGAYETGLFGAFYLYAKYRKFDEENLKQSIRLMSNYLDYAARRDYNYVPQAIRNCAKVISDTKQSVLENIKSLLDDEESLKASFDGEWLELFYQVEAQPLSSGTARWLLEISASDFDLAHKYYKEIFSKIFKELDIYSNRLIVDLWSYSRDKKVESLCVNNIFPQGSQPASTKYSWWSFFHEPKKAYVMKELIDNDYKNKFETNPSEKIEEIKHWYNIAPSILEKSRRFRSDRIDFEIGNKKNRDFIVRDQINPTGYKKILQLEVLREILNRYNINIEVSQSTNARDMFYSSFKNYIIQYLDFSCDMKNDGHFYIFREGKAEVGQEIFKDTGTIVSKKVDETVKYIIDLNNASTK